MSTAAAETECVWFTFRVGRAWLGVPAQVVEEICEYAEPVPVPRAPSYVRGLVGRRADALVIVDLGRFLGLEAAEQAEPDDALRTPRAVVVRVADLHVGLACDRLTGLRQVDPDRTRPPELARGHRLERYARAELVADAGVLSLLDLQTLLEDARIKG